MTWDGKALGQEIVGAVKAHVSEIVGPILKRLEALEAVSPKKGDKGDAGIDGIPGKDGTDGVPGRDGVDGKDAVLTADMVVEAVKAIPDALQGAVNAYLADNPPAAGKDGRDGSDGKAGQDGKDGSAGIDGKDGAPGKDGCGVKELLIDRTGNLVATMEDGRMKELGPVVGKDGAPGLDGKVGTPGRDGTDGADGLGFDDMDFEVRDDGCYLTFTKGEIVKEARLPIPIYRGVWSEGETYHKGNSVTWGGSSWIAQADPTGKPDAPDSGWRLSVKKGRDGKDAPPANAPTKKA